MTGKKVGPFDLEEKIGVGGMGIVYRARYRKNDRIVALKLLTPQLSENPKLVARFEREMEILEKLDHPNITRYYGGGKVDGHYFIAMRLMSRGTLAQLLRKKGQLPWEQVVEFGGQVCDALDHAHRVGVIHRDLKPANLFLRMDKQTGREKLVLGDFGIARDLEADGLTATGMTVGTYRYMAPEQITGKQPVSAKTDLYSLGCVLFQMLAGRTPYTADSQGEILVQHLQEDPPSVREFAHDCPVWLENVLLQTLEKDPADRPMDAPYLKMALDEVIDRVANKEGITSHAASGEPTAMTMSELNPDLKKAIRKGTKRKKKKKRDNSPVYERAWFLSLCLVALITGVTWAVWPPGEEELFAQAQPLMESEEPADHGDAIRKFLTPMIERFPEGRHADETRAFIRQFEADRLFRRLKRLKNPETEPERLFVEAWKFEQFGDRVSAVEKYRSMAVLLAERDEFKSYVALAESRVAEIESSADEPVDRIELVNSELREADQLILDGKRLKAQSIWNSVINLYAGNQELLQQVDYARARIKGEEPEGLDLSPRESDETEIGANPETSSE